MPIESTLSNSRLRRWTSCCNREQQKHCPRIAAIHMAMATQMMRRIFTFARNPIQLASWPRRCLRRRHLQRTSAAWDKCTVRSAMSDCMSRACDWNVYSPCGRLTKSPGVHLTFTVNFWIYECLSCFALLPIYPCCMRRAKDECKVICGKCGYLLGAWKRQWHAYLAFKFTFV